MRHGRGGMGSHKHGTSGYPGHNRDMIQTAREINRERDQDAKINELRRTGKLRRFGSVAELIQDQKKKRWRG